MKVPKVLVMTPIYEGKDYCLGKFLQNAKKLTYPNFKHIFIDNSKTDKYVRKLKSLGLEAYWVKRGNNSRESLARAQIFGRKKAIEGEYDYLFSLESDIMPPADIIQRLMSHGKDVITAMYFIGIGNNKIPCITLPYFDKRISAMGTRLLKLEEINDYYKKGLQRVQAGGFGTALISKRVFQRFGFYYDPRFEGHSDIYFFNELYNNNIPVFVDTDIICDHDNSDWMDVKDR